MNEEAPQKIIVLADDDPFITHAYKVGLEEAGYVIIVATDGEETLNQVRALRPDLLIMELILPKIDGFTVLKTIKSDPIVADVPVIVLTSLTQPADEAEARSSGAAEVLVKSEVALQDVLMRIERLLASKP